jgi:inhibitor of cysteine peptidase
VHRLAEADSGTTLRAAPGEEVLVELAENPTTGYVWHHVDPDGSGLVLVSSDFDPPNAAAVGAGGVRRLRFRVSGAGRRALVLVLKRPWESGGSEVGNWRVDLDVS